jgi:uncharacterized membrane protein YukC
MLAGFRGLLWTLTRLAWDWEKLLPWKGIALWKSARNKQMKWFIVLPIVNTLAILPIVCIFYFSKKKTEEIIDKNEQYETSNALFVG